MSYISIDYTCLDCGEALTKLRKRSEDLDHYSCECGGEMVRIFKANITRVSYPDGTNNRFSGVKEQRKLAREIRKAKKKGDTDMVSALKQEQGRVREAVKGQTSNICKAEE